jgi:hypothetical protein
MTRKKGHELEQKLIKSATYGFIIGLCIALLYYPDIRTKQLGPGSYEMYTVPLREYIFQILRFAIRASLSALVAVGIIEGFKLRKSGAADFAAGMAKSFVITFALIVVIMIIIGKL